jgi:hypothetical protein
MIEAHARLNREFIFRLKILLKRSNRHVEDRFGIVWAAAETRSLPTWAQLTENCGLRPAQNGQVCASVSN